MYRYAEIYYEESLEHLENPERGFMTHSVTYTSEPRDLTVRCYGKIEREREREREKEIEREKEREKEGETIREIAILREEGMIKKGKIMRERMRKSERECVLERKQETNVQ